MEERLFTVGAVAGAHGIKGDMKIFPMTDDIDKFKTLDSILLSDKKGIREYKIEKVWYHKKFVMLKLEGIDNMDAVLALKGAEVKVTEAFAVPLLEGEYYWRDLLGMAVSTEDGEYLGELTDILETGANDVYEVDKKLYIPAIKDCILDVDVAAKKMTVHLLEGLR